MKNISILTFVTATFSAFVLTISSMPAFAATVASLTNIGETQNESGETIALVDVKCSSASSEPRFIFSKEGERAWCSKDIPDICTRTKLTAAQRVCRPGFTAQIEEYKNSEGDVNNSSTVAVVDQPINEVDLEKEQIKIEQQKLEIRKQELELTKRRLELERQAQTAQ